MVLLLLLACLQDDPELLVDQRFGRLRHPDRIEHLSWSPDGKTIVTSGRWDSPLRLWDASTGKDLGAVSRTMGASSATFSPDGTLLAYDHKQSLVVRELAGGKERFRTPIINAMYAGIAFSPDGKTVLTGGTDCLLRLSETATGRELFRWEAKEESIFVVQFSPDGRSFAMCGGHGSVRVWDAATRGAPRQLRGRGDSTIRCLAFSPDSRRLAGTGKTDPVLIWDLVAATEQSIARGGNEGTAVAFSPDGGSIAVGLNSGSVSVLDAATGKERFLREGRLTVSSVAYSPDGKTLAVGDESGALRLYDVDGKDKVSSQGHTSDVTSLTLSPDGRTLVSSSGDRTVCLWNIASGDQKAALLLQPEECYPARAYALVGGGVLAVDNQDKLLWWKTGTGEPEVAARKVRSAAVDPSGGAAAILGTDGGVRSWDPVQGAGRTGFETGREDLGAAAFSSDGKRLAISSGAGLRIEMREMATGERLWGIEEAGPDGRHEGPQLAFSPVAGVLACSKSEARIDLRDERTGRLLETVKVKSSMDEPVRFAFSPDGRLLAAANPDGEIRCFEAFTGEEAFSLKVRPESRAVLVFAADGKSIFSGGRDGDVVRTRLERRSASPKLDLDAAWASLGGDAATAWPASVALAAGGAPAVEFLRRKLDARVNAADLKRHLSALEEEDAGARKRAHDALGEAAPLADEAIRAALAAAKDAEVRERLASIVADLDSPLVRKPAFARLLRAIWVLERAGARDALEALAGAGRLGREAEAAAARLRR